MEYGYGIDLGTTNSCIARATKKGVVEIIKNCEGDDLTPSVVEFSEANILVGNAAKESARINRANVIENIKSHMGRDDFYYTFNETKFTPVDISTEILKKLVYDAEQEVHDKIKDVIITVPAYFSDPAKHDTIEAAKKAGLNVIELIYEPSAAALAYSNKYEGMIGKTVLVYDLGGGTFDVTLAKIVDVNDVQVLHRDGNCHLGGKHWDADLEKYVISELCDKTNATEDDISRNLPFYNKIGIEVEEAKKRLSRMGCEKTPIYLNWNGKDVQIDISRTKFDEITRGRLLSTIDLTKKVFDLARNEPGCANKAYNELVDEIILVGGSTKMKQVSEELYNTVGIKPVIFEQNLAVAKGAALFATGSCNIAEVANKSFGVSALNSDDELILCNIIKKGTKTPCSISDTYYTAYDGQDCISPTIYENESKEDTHRLNAADVREIERFTLQLPYGVRAGSPIKVTISIDRGGILKLVAEEMTTHTKCEIKAEINRN